MRSGVDEVAEAEEVDKEDVDKADEVNEVADFGEVGYVQYFYEAHEVCLKPKPFTDRKKVFPRYMRKVDSSLISMRGVHKLLEFQLNVSQDIDVVFIQLALQLQLNRQHIVLKACASTHIFLQVV